MHSVHPFGYEFLQRTGKAAPPFRRIFGVCDPHLRGREVLRVKFGTPDAAEPHE
jgi:hypothetical protein